MSVQDGRITNRATPIGKGDKARFIRPVERQRMRPWLIEHLDKNDVPGLAWQHKRDRIFRIAWKHAANQCFNMEKDTNLFERWAVHTGRHQDSDHKRWKANFRCALNSLPDVHELKEQGIKKGNNAFKVYKFLDEREAKTNKDGKTRKKKDLSYLDFEFVKEEIQEKYDDEADSAVASIRAPMFMSLPNLPQLQQPSTSGIDMLVGVEHDDDNESTPVNMDNLQEILAAATASLAAGGDAFALERISIEQLSRLGEVSRMKLDIRRSDKSLAVTTGAPDHMYVFLCNWCEKVFPSKVELFQHLLVVHQDKLLTGEAYHPVQRKDGSDIQREIEDLEQKVFNFTREKYKSKEAEDVIEDGEVVDINTTNLMTSQEVYIEDQALDLTVNNSEDSPSSLAAVKQEIALDLSVGPSSKKMSALTKVTPKLITKKRRSGAKDMDYIVKFSNYGLAGAPRTKRQLSLMLKKKEEEEKAKKAGVEADSNDPSKQHSMEDLVHAEILISLKSAANEDEDDDDEHMDTDEEIHEGEKSVEGKSVLKQEQDVSVETDEEMETQEPETEHEDSSIDKAAEVQCEDTEEAIGSDNEDSMEDNVDLGDVDGNEITKVGKKKGVKRFKCETCSAEFDDAETMCAHFMEHKHDYMCGMCHNIFDNKETYVTHLESHFPPIQVSSDAGKQKTKGLFTCEICKKTCHSMKALSTHKKFHYTVIPVRMGSDKEQMTMVVHPSSSVLRISAVKDTKENSAKITDKETLKQTPETVKTDREVQGDIATSASGSNIIETVPKDSESNKTDNSGTSVVVVRNEEGIVKITKEIGNPNEGILKDKQPGKASSSGHDSVDGMHVQEKETDVNLKEVEVVASKKRKQTISKEAKNVTKEKDSEADAQLPAFSEIVRDVDEFFIKDVKLDKPTEGLKTPAIEMSDSEDDETLDKRKASQKPETDKETVNVVEVDMKTEVDVKEGGKEGYKCMICKEEQGEDTYFEHMKSHSLYELATAKASLDKLKAPENSESCTEGDKKSNMFVCKLCSQYYQTFDELRSHVTSHLGSNVAVHDEGYCRKAATKGPKRGKKRKGVVSETVDTKKLKQTTKQKVNQKPKCSPGTSILAAALNSGPKYKLQIGGLDVVAIEAEHTPEDDTDADPSPDSNTKVTRGKGKKTSAKLQQKSQVTAAGDADSTTDRSGKIGDKLSAESSESAITKTQDLESSTTTQQTASIVTPTIMQNFASKLLVQGMQTYLLNSNQQVDTTQVPAEVTVSNHDASGGTKVAPVRLVAPGPLTNKLAAGTSLSQLKLVTTENKTSSPQQVILIKPGVATLGSLGTVPIQIATSLPASAIVPTSTTVSSTIQVEKPTPVALIKNIFSSAGSALNTTNATPQISTPLSSSVPTTPISYLPKLTIPLSALQNLPSVNLTPSPAISTNQTIPVTLQTASTKSSINPARKVNPQVQSNLLNMVLARMAQPGPPPKVALPGTLPKVDVPKVSTPKISISIAQPAPPSQNPIAPVTVQVLKQEGGGISAGLALYCNVCRQKLTSLEQMSSHKCPKSNVANVSIEVAGFSLRSEPAVSLLGTSTPVPLQVATPSTSSSPSTPSLAKSICGDTGFVTVTSGKGQQKCLIKCSKCPFNASEKSKVSEHMREAHNIEFHQCKNCSQCFDSPRSLEVHYAVDHCFECTICMLRMKKQQIQAHAAQHCVRKVADCFQCLTCKGIFLSFDQYKEHSASCSFARLLKPVRHMVIHCEGCSLSSRNKSQVLAHIKKQHIQKVFYHCGICYQPFFIGAGMKVNLTAHLAKHNTTGSEEETCFCHTCFLGYSSKESLGLHQTTSEHNAKVAKLSTAQQGAASIDQEGEGNDDPKVRVSADKHGDDAATQGTNPKSSKQELLTCDECNMLYSSLFQLKQHKVIRHGKTRKARLGQCKVLSRVREKKVVCDYCKNFYSKFKLGTHQKSCKQNPTSRRVILLLSDPNENDNDQTSTPPQLHVPVYEDSVKEDACDIENC